MTGITDVRWPVTRFGVDLNKAVPSATQSIGGASTIRSPLQNLPFDPFSISCGEVIVTSSATYNVNGATELILIFNRTSGLAATTVNLPSLNNRGNVPLAIKDWARNTGTYPITIVPNGAETIMGAASWTLSSDFDNTGVYLWPLPALNGWYVFP